MNESESHSKLLRVGNQDKEDRISSLPDGILCNILSFLPFKYAVATCILSSRWKFLWTSLPNLCFAEAQIMTDDGWHSFEKFVNMVLLLSDSAINKFSLSSITRYNFSQLKFWVSSAISRNVRELELQIYDDCRPKRDNMDFGGIELPESIYTSKTLENLKLDLKFFVKTPPPEICFPSVKILYVFIYSTNKNLSERLFCNCPMLEDLSVLADMDYDCYDTLANFNISSTTLRRLTLKNWILWASWNEHQVIVRAPNLEYLCIEDASLSSYVLHELLSLTTVSVNIDEHFLLQDIEDFEFLDVQADRLLQLLHGITNTKFLSLSAGAIYLLNCTSEDLFPTFPNLTSLKVEVAKSGWQFRHFNLISMPKLEAFVLEMKFNFKWIEPHCAAQCLLLHIKKIEILRFGGQKDEMELVKYLLKNGEGLNRMMIGFTNSALKEKLCQELLRFERGSTTCEVQFL